jgi:LmbE family N-acetylglucosaminyl deacetylase
VKIRRAGTVVVLCTMLLCASGRAQYAPTAGAGLPESVEAIDSARVTTRILYVTAHPDDESAAVLTYLARGLHADVALLSLTRGEGGQNALGPEQAPQLGLIRTQELLAATRGYGVGLYFTRAKDFGFSKTPEETERIWGDQVLDDMVRVIRSFRPDIVINNWGGVHTGHGHHQAAGLLTPRAVAMAADEKSFADQLHEGLRVWGGGNRRVAILDLDRFGEKPTGYVLPLDEVSPLWGKSYRQIGIEAFGNHRTQGITAFLNSPFLRRPIGLKNQDGSAPDPRSFAEPLTRLLGDPEGAFCKEHRSGCEQLKSADEEIVQARKEALLLDWAAATEHLALAYRQINALRSPDGSSSPGPLGYENQVDLRLAALRVQKALLLAAGFTFTARSLSGFAVEHEPVEVTVADSCRPGVRCPVGGAVEFPSEWEVKAGTGDRATGEKYQITLKEKPAAGGIWQQLLPEPDAAATATLEVAADEQHQLPVTVPVLYPDVGTAHARLVPLRIVPAYTLAVEPKSVIKVLEAQHQPLDVLVRVHSYSRRQAKTEVALDVPDGWSAAGSVEIKFDGDGDRYAKLTANPPGRLEAGNFTLSAFVKEGGRKFGDSLEPLPSMPTLLWKEPAECIVHAFAINVPRNLHVGYITAEGEPIPDALRMLGIQVDLLDAAALNFGDLSRYDAIVVGVRAYELRSELPGANQRLLDYVSAGGTLLVQYQRDFAWDGKNFAPFPAKISSSQPGQPLPRITDETAAVHFLKPDDPLLNTPNKITAQDFDGWVQERGLYFWTEFDTTKYTPLLSMHDPGEKDLNGALVYAKVGKGTYIYTGLAFFRQLPEGVPGAYRLFVNLLSASRSPGSTS